MPVEASGTGRWCLRRNYAAAGPERRGTGGGRSGLQRQPVGTVTDDLVTGFAHLAAAARASPASGKGAAKGSRRIFIPGLPPVPFVVAGLVVPPQRADLLPGHRRQGLNGDREAQRPRRNWRCGGTRRLKGRPGDSFAARTPAEPPARSRRISRRKKSGVSSRHQRTCARWGQLELRCPRQQDPCPRRRRHCPRSGRHWLTPKNRAHSHLITF